MSTGPLVPGMASFDRNIPGFMRKFCIPGGAISVTRDERLVYSRGFGYADREAKRLVQPDSLFRIASLSKTITAAAILLLHERNALHLDDKMVSFFPDKARLIKDSKLREITIRQLLSHTAGWDREASFDPTFEGWRIAGIMGVSPPAPPSVIIDYMWKRPLDFVPGTRFVYSNFGYMVLGRIIEKVTGKSYGQFVSAEILHPVGARRMRLGSARSSRAPEEEVHYYDKGTSFSAFGGEDDVPLPYAFALDHMDSQGGWVGSTVDVLRFLTAIDGRRNRRDLLKPETVAEMVRRPEGNAWDSASPHYYGLGLNVNRDVDNWWHFGGSAGTTSVMVRTGTGLAWVALFNARSRCGAGDVQEELDRAIWGAVDEVKEWPTRDLFEGEQVSATSD